MGAQPVPSSTLSHSHTLALCETLQVPLHQLSWVVGAERTLVPALSTQIRSSWVSQEEVMGQGWKACIPRALTTLPPSTRANAFL